MLRVTQYYHTSIRAVSEDLHFMYKRLLEAQTRTIFCLLRSNENVARATYTKDKYAIAIRKTRPDLHLCALLRIIALS